MRKFIVKYFLILSVPAAVFFPLRADVYLPASAAAVSSVADCGGAVFRRACRINGIPLELEVYSVKSALADFLTRLTCRFPAASVCGFGNGARVEISSGNSLERLLVISCGDDRPLTVFRTVLPPDAVSAEPVWSKDLPRLPAGAAPLQVLEFSGGTVCGMFSINGDAGPVFRVSDSGLRSAGWIPAADSEDSGGMYRRGDELLQTEFSSSGIGTYCLYRR